MAAGKYNIVIEQGSTFNMNFTIKTGSTPWDLTSYTARMQIRSSVGADTSVLSLTNGNGITLGDALGTVAVSISAAATAAIVAGRYVYDLEIQSAGGEVWRVIEGKATVRAEVTR